MERERGGERERERERGEREGREREMGERERERGEIERLDFNVLSTVQDQFRTRVREINVRVRRRMQCK